MLKVSIAALLLCGSLSAAEISGIVLEAGGSPSALATVTIKSRSGGIRRDVRADPDGKYRVPDLPPDSYVLTAQSVHSGDSAALTAVVHEGQSINLPIQLTEPLYGRDTPVTRGQEGGNLEGYGPYGIRGNLSINSVGQRGQNNNFLLDGMDNNDAWLHGVALVPPVEAIESFSLTAVYLPAEFGRATGAVVNVQTRSGTNQLHGSGFDYFQNSTLNARNFFDGADKPAATRNQFGASLGGPIRKNDWFFFLNAEALRERQGLTVISTVPTAVQKTGDFGNIKIFDPFSISPAYIRLPFANNRIPASMIPAAARNLVALYPDPNLPGTADNYRFTPALINNGTDFGAHSDKILTPRSSLSARFDVQHRNQQSPSALPNSASDYRQHADDANTSLTAWNGGISHSDALSPTLLNQFRIGANQIRMNGDPNDAGLATIAPEGFVQLGANNAVPFRIRTTSYQLEDSVRWTRGRHTFQAGLSIIRRNAAGSASEWSSRGNFLFTPDYTSQQGVAQTGDSMASLLLGFPTEVRRDVQLADYRLRAWELAGFIQDELRIGRRLTIQAGIRYALDPPLTEAGNRMVNFHFETNGPELVEFAGQNGVNGYAGVSLYRKAIAPRIGFTFDVFGTGATILRGGFSKAYDPGSYITTGALARNAPYASRLDQINGTFQLGSNLTDGFPAVNASNRAVYAIGPGNYEPYADQWGLAIEQRLPARLTLEIAGQSSMGAHLYERYDANQPYPAPTPYPFARYPFEPYHGRVDYLDLAGGSTYYGGQLKLTGQPLPGLHWVTTYLYAKSIDDSTAPGTDQDSRPPGPQYIYALRAMRSVSPFDIPQRLMLTASYELPFHVRVGTLITIQSGLPFTPQLAVNSLNNGGFQLPNRVGSGDFPASRQSYLQWFNTSLNGPGSAFELPPLYQYGNSGFGILRGPGLANTDVSLARDFALRESLHLRTRVEAFNLLNRTNFALPERILGVESSGVISHTATPSRRMQLLVKLEW